MEKDTFKAPEQKKKKETCIAIVGSSSLGDLTHELPLLLNLYDFHKPITAVKIMGSKKTSADALGKLFAEYHDIPLVVEGGSSSPLPQVRKRAASKLIERNEIVVVFWDCVLGTETKQFMDLAMISKKTVYAIPKDKIEHDKSINTNCIYFVVVAGGSSSYSARQ